MKNKRFCLLTSIFAIALTFFACSDDSSGNDPKLCGGVEYDVNIYRCDSGELIGKCKGVDFYPAYQVCDNGVIEDKASSSSSSLSNATSSSSVATSSNSIRTSSSSITAQSSSSFIAKSSNSVIQSSSSVATSSSSAVFNNSSSSSSDANMWCEDFINGTRREHYGKDKPQFCDERDGKKYVYVTIGEQVWMAENLNYSIINSICNTYGCHYKWSTAMGFDSFCDNNSCASQIQQKHQGICPSGWHLPSKDEWDMLSSYVQSSNNCTSCDARLLKATSGWKDNGNGIDFYGFSALAAGLGNGEKIQDAGLDGYWWDASEFDSSKSYYRRIFASSSQVQSNYDGKDWLHTVRCLKD